MAGYNGFSMSNNAVQAYDDGLVPLSKLPRKFQAACRHGLIRYAEAHHTSKRYNLTKFYDLDAVREAATPEILDEAARLDALAKSAQAEERAAKESHRGGTFQWARITLNSYGKLGWRLRCDCCGEDAPRYGANKGDPHNCPPAKPAPAPAVAQAERASVAPVPRGKTPAQEHEEFVAACAARNAKPDVVARVRAALDTVSSELLESWVRGGCHHPAPEPITRAKHLSEEGWTTIMRQARALVSELNQEMSA